MADVLGSLERIAQTDANVLVCGESGAGKENVVRALHTGSPRATGPFVAVNCGAIPESLLESTLFGHEKGAFTGADRKHIGRFEAASHGTLFLDEISEMPLALQVKLLRVIQERTFESVGSNTTRQVDFRLIAATNRSLEDAVRDGSFREDLFYRLDVVRVAIPSLRERPMDVPLLAHHFLEMYRTQHRSEVTGFTEAAMGRMVGDTWPGNVRQLENLVQSILVLKPEGEVQLEDIERRLGPADGHASGDAAMRLNLPPSGLDMRATMDAVERQLMRQALRRVEGNRAQAAELLGLKRTTLVEKLKRNPVDD